MENLKPEAKGGRNWRARGEVVRLLSQSTKMYAVHKPRPCHARLIHRDYLSMFNDHGQMYMNEAGRRAAGPSGSWLEAQRAEQI